jgi:peptidoglycan/xylan/chitin deacetylase (PgdA/CDA1 family)
VNHHGNKKLTLSFDNGPHHEVTPWVLDTLAARDIRSTFFVCGKDIQHPEQQALLRRTKAEGHRLGNHTFHHGELGVDPDPEAPAREIGATQALLGDLAESQRWFRPAGGGGVLGPRLLSRHAVDYLCEERYSLVLWNSVPRDWEDPTGWTHRALAEAEANPWTLLVLHDAPTGAMAALPHFLDQLIDRGINIVREFPDGCVPIRQGERVGAIDHLIT